MATFSEIKEVRLAIHDPQGDPRFIDFLEVATLPVNPSVPAYQTGYKLTTDSVYYSTEKEAPTVSTDYSKEELYTSDATLTIWIDAKGVEYASCQALKSIVATLGQELRLKSTGAGAERTDWNDLQQTYNYYKALLALCKEEYNSSINNNSGTFGQMAQPEIAGGNY